MSRFGTESGARIPRASSFYHHFVCEDRPVKRPPLPTDTALLTTREVAYLCRLSVAKVRELALGRVRRDGPRGQRNVKASLPSVSFGRRRLFRRTTIEAYLIEKERIA